MNYYQRHLGDYARDTGHLTLLEHGVYTVLLDWQYGTAKPLPKEIDSVQRICRAFSKVERETVVRVREEFFNVDGWNNRAKNEIDEYHKTGLSKRVKALRQHHPELASLTDEQVVEWCKTSGEPLDVQRKTCATRARTKNQEPRTKIEGGGATDSGATCQVADAEVLKWSAAWPGESASGCPVMDRAWVELKLVQLNGRREWPANWQRWLIACWRGEHRSFHAGEQNHGPKKNAPVSASVEEISRQKRIRDLSDEEDELSYAINAIRQGNIEAPADKVARLKLVRDELKKLRDKYFSESKNENQIPHD